MLVEYSCRVCIVLERKVCWKIQLKERLLPKTRFDLRFLSHFFTTCTMTTLQEDLSSFLKENIESNDDFSLQHVQNLLALRKKEQTLLDEKVHESRLSSRTVVKLFLFLPS